MATGYLTLACFGKLPFWREYLEVGPALPSSRALKKWLHSGKEEFGLVSGEHLQPDEIKDERIEAHLRVLLALPGAKELLVGVIRPSNDAGGRHFPFAVFAHLPKRAYGKHYAMLPMAMHPVWEVLDDAWEALGAVATKGAFEEALDSIQVPEPVAVAEARSQFRGRHGEDAGRLVEGWTGTSLDRVIGSIPPIVGGIKKIESEGACLRFPVARELGEACFNTSLWIDLLNRQFRLHRVEPSVLLDERAASGGRQVYLKFGSLTAADYLGILGLQPQTAPPWAGEATNPEQEPSAAGMTYGRLLEMKLRRARGGIQGGSSQPELG
jgi:type VI secretion system ImpM family protein